MTLERTARNSRAENSFTLFPEQICVQLGVNAIEGLSIEDVCKLRRAWGRNELPCGPGPSFWKLVWKQFDDLLVKILVAAALTSLILGLANSEGMYSLIEPSVIVFILIANALVGVMTETNAAKAIEELGAYQAEVATVLRSGSLMVCPATELVPGDIVDLSVGDRIPADIRLYGIIGSSFRVDQALLTGESDSVVKSVEKTAVTKAVMQDKTCMAYSGTVVTAGRARGVVVATGAFTAIGQIQDAMTAVDSMDEATPLKRKLDEFGTFLSKVIAAICILVWLVNIGHFSDSAHGGLFRGAIHYFKVAVALAVAAIPEGLPAVVTTCLALGTRKMAKQKAIVRTLSSVETLGCTSVICSDKTGTLTTNGMSVKRMCAVNHINVAADHQNPLTNCLTDYNVSGNGYAPDGVISEELTGEVVNRPANLASILHLAICSSLCNDSSLSYNGRTNSFDKIGESTEVALRVLAEKVGLPGFDDMPRSLTYLSLQDRATHCATYWRGQFERTFTLEFDRDRKMMSVISKRKGQSILFTKGSPEAVLLRCTQVLTNSKGIAEPITTRLRDALTKKYQTYARESLRVLAFAMRPISSDKGHISHLEEKGLTFLGFCGMMDPPRSEVRGAVDICRGAGIKVVMVTGDNKLTAEAVANQIGLDDCSGSGSHPTTSTLARQMTAEAAAAGLPMTGVLFPPDKSFQGLEFDEMDRHSQSNAALSMSVFSRVEPRHKTRLVELFKERGQVVAMTGDGVNDAPALRRADIGIAMGSGTAVAKNAADMVLADDNFATIVAAVAEGRAIFNNTKQFVRYMVSSNIGGILSVQHQPKDFF